MKPRSYSSEGVVLARRNYGEADRIISVFTKSHGRVSYLAKGIRRPKSKKRGHLEVFGHISFQAVTGKGLDLITEAENIDDFSEVKKSLKKVSLAYYFMEVIGRITKEGEKNIELYELILMTLGKLKTAKLLRQLRLDFISRLLVLLGYWPERVNISDPDYQLEEVIEKQLYSERVGKRVIQ